MYRKCLSALAGLLAVAAFALIPGDALARGPRGGGGGGGWHGGGGGGWHGGGGYRGGYYGGRGWGWGGVGIGIGLGYPYYGGYGYGGGYWPGYYSSYSYPYYGSGFYSDSYPYFADTDNSYIVNPTYSDTMGSEYAYGASRNNDAVIRVIVPPEAKLWFDGQTTQQSGSMRMFETPSLTPGQTFHYDVKAKWLDKDGKEVTRTKRVDVSANSRMTVDLTQLNPEQAPAPNPKK